MKKKTNKIVLVTILTLVLICGVITSVPVKAISPAETFYAYKEGSYPNVGGIISSNVKSGSTSEETYFKQVYQYLYTKRTINSINTKSITFSKNEADEMVIWENSELDGKTLNKVVSDIMCYTSTYDEMKQPEVYIKDDSGWSATIQYEMSLTNVKENVWSGYHEIVGTLTLISKGADGYNITKTASNTAVSTCEYTTVQATSPWVYSKNDITDAYGDTFTQTASGYILPTWSTEKGWHSVSPYTSRTGEHPIMPVSMKVYYDENGGEGSMSFNTVSAETLSKNGYYWHGYKFVGWTLSPDGEGDVYTNEASIMALSPKDNKQVTLYAKWDTAKTRVMFNGNGSEYGTMIDQYGNVGETISLTKNSYIRDGYEFVAWCTKSNGVGTMYRDEATYTFPEEEQTLYAVWSKVIDYDVTKPDEGVEFEKYTVYSRFIDEELDNMNSNSYWMSKNEYASRLKQALETEDIIASYPIN